MSAMPHARTPTPAGPRMEAQLLSDKDLSSTAARLDSAPPQEIVRWALQNHRPGRVAVVTGLQADGVAIADMALAVDPGVRVVTIDTGRLPRATYQYIDVLRRHFGRPIEVLLPDHDDVQRFVTEYGVNSFYSSVERRLDCCHHRKVAPLERVLETVDCWMTGLRRSQSASRATTPVVQRDLAHGGVVKVNPLASWSDDRVSAYLAARGVPFHPLYAEGYTSIGCEPCTRATTAGEDPRAGRWWWEYGLDKECGIHGRPVLRRTA
jgi:phosphoadenosine phosphosulfate reductase